MFTKPLGGVAFKAMVEHFVAPAYFPKQPIGPATAITQPGSVRGGVLARPMA
jgi:hypothetical protein